MYFISVDTGIIPRVESFVDNLFAQVIQHLQKEEPFFRTETSDKVALSKAGRFLSAPAQKPSSQKACKTSARIGVRL
jgi:hypothetical protein